MFISHFHVQFLRNGALLNWLEFGIIQTAGHIVSAFEAGGPEFWLQDGLPWLF